MKIIHLVCLNVRRGLFYVNILRSQNVILKNGRAQLFFISCSNSYLITHYFFVFDKKKY